MLHTWPVYFEWWRVVMVGQGTSAGGGGIVQGGGGAEYVGEGHDRIFDGRARLERRSLQDVMLKC